MSIIFSFEMWDMRVTTYIQHSSPSGKLSWSGSLWAPSFRQSLKSFKTRTQQLNTGKKLLQMDFCVNKFRLYLFPLFDTKEEENVYCFMFCLSPFLPVFYLYLSNKCDLFCLTYFPLNYARKVKPDVRIYIF